MLSHLHTINESDDVDTPWKLLTRIYLVSFSSLCPLFFREDLIHCIQYSFLDLLERTKQKLSIFPSTYSCYQLSNLTTLLNVPVAWYIVYSFQSLLYMCNMLKLLTKEILYHLSTIYINSCYILLDVFFCLLVTFINFFKCTMNLLVVTSARSSLCDWWKLWNVT